MILSTGHQSRAEIMLSISAPFGRGSVGLGASGNEPRASVTEPLGIPLPFESGGDSLAQRGLSGEAQLGAGAGRIAGPVSLARIEDLVAGQDTGPTGQPRQQIRETSGQICAPDGECQGANGL